MSKSDYQRSLKEIESKFEDIAQTTRRIQQGVIGDQERQIGIMKLKSLQHDILRLESDLKTQKTLREARGEQMPDEKARRSRIQALKSEAKNLEIQLYPRRWWQFWKWF